MLLGEAPQGTGPLFPSCSNTLMSSDLDKRRRRFVLSECELVCLFERPCERRPRGLTRQPLLVCSPSSLGLAASTIECLFTRSLVFHCLVCAENISRTLLYCFLALLSNISISFSATFSKHASYTFASLCDEHCPSQ